MPENSKSPVRVNDGFHDIQLGANELKILLQMYDHEIPDVVETDDAAFREVVHKIVKDAFTWLEWGLEKIAEGYSDLDYEPTNGQSSCQIKEPESGA